MLLKNNLFLHIGFSLIFRRCQPRFGRSWGGFGRFLANQNGLPKGKIDFFNKIGILWILRRFGKRPGRVWGSFWEGFGRACGLFGRHGGLSACFGCFGSFVPCFFHLAVPRGASAASVARHVRGKSRKEERQDEEEAFLKFAWLFLLLLAIAAFYCFFFA